MKKIVKRISAMGAAVMMMSSMAIGASAYEAIKYGRAVGGSGSNAYISCFVTGIRTNSTVHIYNDKVHGNYSTTLSVDSQ